MAKKSALFIQNDLWSCLLLLAVLLGLKSTQVSDAKMAVSQREKSVSCLFIDKLFAKLGWFLYCWDFFVSVQDFSSIIWVVKLQFTFMKIDYTWLIMGPINGSTKKWTVSLCLFRTKTLALSYMSALGWTVELGMVFHVDWGVSSPSDCS